MMYARQTGSHVATAPRCAAWRRWTAGLVGALAALATVAPQALALGTETLLVSRAGGAGGAPSNGGSAGAAMSASGRYVAFTSTATNLVADDTDPAGDVYVRDMSSGRIALVSRAASPQGAKGNGWSAGADITADGRYVLFTSEATNLHPDDTDALRDVYVRDLASGKLTLVSRRTDGTKGNANSATAAVAAGGRYVVFASDATNLDDGDTDATTDLFLRDVAAGTTTLVSRATGVAGAKGDGASSGFAQPSISADGRMVAFASESANLDPADGDATTDVFVRDTHLATTQLVSRASGEGGAKANSDADGPAISGDGRSVAFTSWATNLVPGGPNYFNIYVRDLAASATALVSRADGEAGAAGNGSSSSPALSFDGRFVAFVTGATNLHRDDPFDAPCPCNGIVAAHDEDIILRDRTTATNTLVSRADGPTGVKASRGRGSFSPAVSGDGRWVAFSSDASNLGAGPSSASRVYMRGGPTPQPPPTDPTPVPQPGCSALGTVTEGTAGADLITGMSVPDVIFGRAGNDRLRGGGRDDCLYGDDGDDRVSGGLGDDLVRGGTGKDRVNGDAGNDRLQGDVGDDRLVDRAGIDRLSGGPGNDHIDARDTKRRDRRRDRRDTIVCGKGVRDVVLADRTDRVAGDCERVRRR